MIAALIGSIVCRPAIRDRLVARAVVTPDTHLYRDDGTPYMLRYWLFNPIDPVTWKRKYSFIPFSLRIHHILAADLDRHLHDHPFNARVWILRGGYDEVREAPPTLAEPNWGRDQMVEISRMPGDSFAIGFDQFHKIAGLHQGGSVSLFMFGGYKGQWGFLVDGRKMLRPEYQRRYKPGSPGACKAVQHSDQTVCRPCDLAWDTNDQHRPPCGKSANK
jgi:hypothetical protein